MQNDSNEGILDSSGSFLGRLVTKVVVFDFGNPKGKS
jgi:hypothetical protein